MRQMTTKQSEGPLIGQMDRLRSSQNGLLRRVIQRHSLPLSEASSQIDELRALMALGYLSLSIVQYPWGLDFELVATRKCLEGGISE
jgi:hypothetical protein